MTLLKDETAIRKFVDNVVPEIKDDEILLIFLAARSKYAPGIRMKTDIVRREIVKRKDRELILKKIRRLSIVDKLYTDNYGKILPEHSFVIYFDLNPKSTMKAYLGLQKQMSQTVYDIAVGHKKLESMKRIKNALMSELHKCNSNKPYLLADIDIKDKNKLYLTEILSTIPFEDIKAITETKNGYHIIVNKTKNTGRILYTMKKDYLEMKKEVMTPVPGTLQGGFLVKGLYDNGSR